MVLTVLSRIFSNNLPIVSRRFMGRYDEGSAGSYPGFRMEIMRVCFHTAGMCWARIFVGIITHTPALVMISLEFQSMCLAFRSRDTRTGSPPFRQVDSTAPIRGGGGAKVKPPGLSSDR